MLNKKARYKKVDTKQFTVGTVQRGTPTVMEGTRVVVKDGEDGLSVWRASQELCGLVV